MKFGFPEALGDILGSKRHFHECPSDPLLEVVFEDEDLLVVNKPAGLVCHPTRHGPFSSVIGRARCCLGGESGSPHLVNRLDRETSGLVAIARNVQAANAARSLWLEGKVEKRYLAVARGEAAFERLIVDAPTGKHPSSSVGIRDAVILSGGKSAKTLIRTLQRAELSGQPLNLLEIRIVSGRKHQIRIHLEWAGLPLLGDKIYGGDEGCYGSFLGKGLSAAQRGFLGVPWQALHAWRLDFPWKGSGLSVCAPCEGDVPWNFFGIPGRFQKTS